MNMNQAIHAPVIIASMSWFHGNISRLEAEDILKKKAENGVFLIRESNRFNGDYSLSMYFEKTIQHYRIRTDPSGYTIDESEYFLSLDKLVNHYVPDADGLVCSLSNYPPKNGLQLHPNDIKAFENNGWLIGIQDIKVGGEIGRGDFSEVFKIFYRGEEKAAKCIKRPSKFSLAGLKEASILTQINHPNCVKCEGIALDEKYLYIVCEYLPNGSLVEYLRSRGKQKISQSLQLKLAKDVCMGMRYLEQLKLVHRDLAARNILLDANLNAKIADFGHCRELNSKDGPGKMPVKWTALEAIMDNKFTHKSDVWSYGVLLWEIFTFGRMPYHSTGVKDVLKMVQEGTRLSRPDDCPLDIYRVMQTMWAENPDDRPSFNKITEFLSIYH